MKKKTAKKKIVPVDISAELVKLGKKKKTSRFMMPLADVQVFMPPKLPAPKILYAGVNWHRGFNNRPEFDIVFDRLPDMSELRYEQKDELYLGFCGAYADFKSYSGKPGSGYCGASFTFHMKDGRVVKAVGPWSSNSNAVCAAFTLQPVVECTAIEDKSYYSAAVSVEALRAHLVRNAGRGLGLAIVESDGVRWYEPTWLGQCKEGGVVKTQLA